MRLKSSSNSGSEGRFQFTHPGRGATIPFPVRFVKPSVSIHAPREGCDSHSITPYADTACFNSRTPGGVRRLIPLYRRSWSQVSIHAPREGCDLQALREYVHGYAVSIHAPREGCDVNFLCAPVVRWVSIHAPREGCDGDRRKVEALASLFQFTHPGRGATKKSLAVGA